MICNRTRKAKKRALINLKFNFCYKLISSLCKSFILFNILSCDNSQHSLCVTLRDKWVVYFTETRT